MFCPACGNEIQEDAEFCNNCGFEIGIEKTINPKEMKQRLGKFTLTNFTESVELTWQDCPLCGFPIVKSIGEYGEFCACSTYPICKFACDEEELEKLVSEPLTPCPICNGFILPRKGRFGKFYGCSNYPQCTFTCQEDELDKIDETDFKKCPNCGGLLFLKKGRDGEFYGCSNYPNCSFTCQVNEINQIENKEYEKCPKCGGIIIKRNEEFITCSNYPRCDYIQNKPLKKDISNR